MTFQLQDIDPEKDFKELIECEWVSYEEPQQTFFRLFCPIIGQGPNSRVESLKESTDCQLKWHFRSYELLAKGCRWQLREDRWSGEDHSEAYWFPAGGQRDFVAQALHQFDAPRAEMAQRPQIYLNIIYTHPEYRRKGIADMVMDWGIKKADEMGVEMWLDATIYSLPFYEKHGFKS
ncbi:uncharacterized protein LY89DRAFT_772535 [Mollisia scopiformis]|uniref:N-acetyltransferase domain-containing protein n=1 Tax=Mollisia scopiformis TaxID=149040 RepID=A0A194XJG7_MOLSC|nr:uncharacterized protein LY89DRAFT_772535 [Mollisia scopiformis]KUJ19902.1 hypothetical protein LY89DRAFT_772535 [Mollisia scopiformis]